MQRVIALLVAAALPLVAGSVTRTLSFSPSDLALSDRDGYEVVELEGAVALVDPGMPRLPRIVEAVAIPAGAAPTGARVTSVEWTTLPGTYHVFPSQADVPLPMPGRDFTPEFQPPDPVVYASTRPFPDRTAGLTGSGTMGGYRIAHVELFPVRWVPATGELQLATRLSYRLDYDEHRGDDRVPTGRQRAMSGDMARALVANPRDVDRFAPRVGRAGATDQLPPGYYEYVVISEPPLDTVFERLADWKTLKGIPATVVTMTWIDANYTGYDLPEKVRNFLVDAYAEWGTMYALLGGSGDYKTSGQDIVPTRKTYYMRCGVGGYPDEDSIPNDLYYGGLDGTWDFDGDHLYGERSDSADMYSEVFIGRASVYNVAQAQNFVHKVLAYEGDPPAGYLETMCLPTAILWSSYEERPMQDSIARMTPAGWTDLKLYERTGTLSAAAMRDAMNAGVGMGNWVGHGNEDGIYMGGTAFMSSTMADALTNGDKLGVNASIGCFCGAWDENPGGDGFAEHLMNRVGGGLVASAMNSRYGYGAYVSGYVPGPSERLDTTFFSQVIDGDMYRAGQSLAGSRAAWAPYADSTGQYDMQRWCIYELNLYGDPELSLWTAEPESLAASHPGVINIGVNMSYAVTVTDGSDGPVEDARVLLWKGDEVYETGFTNASGEVTLYVSPLTPGSMTLTVNARNHYLLVENVVVNASDRYVAYLSSTIDDPGPGGNGDSILNPGESVKVPTWVKNWGQLTANSVTATLRTTDAHATVTDSVKSFGNIAAGDSAWTGSDGFGLAVDAGLANGYAVDCSLHCRDALDSTWVSPVTFLVGTPVLVEDGFVVRDSAQGNNNGRVDPGETAGLEVTVLNEGLGHGYNCHAVLRSSDARFTVPDSTADYGYIECGGSVANAGDLFTIHADAAIPLETPVSCTLCLYADGGYVAYEPLTIIVGEIRQVDPIPDGPRLPSLYYAYDDSDESYEPHPTYDWVEVNAVGTRLDYPHNDDVLTVPFPASFGPFDFYGERFGEISISADGWLCPGSYTERHYRNAEIPSPSDPPGMICPNWDDLYPGESGQGYVYWYHDEPNHRFVVEYDSIAYYNPRSTRDKFEVIIYDTTVATHSGDNLVVVQYMTANRYTSSTFGIENPDGTIGIQALFDGGYHRGCAPMGPGRAIAYTTDPPPVTGFAGDEGGVLDATGVRLRAWPTPFRGRASIAWTVAVPGRVSLKLFDAVGREVRTMVDTEMRPGRYTVSWDGLAGNGQLVAPGVYFCKLESPAGVHRSKVVMAR